MNEKYLLDNNIFYVPYLALSIHHADIVIDEEKYLLLDDKVASIFYILIFDKNINFDVLMDIAKRYEETVSVVSILDIEMKDYGYIHHLKTKQYTYEGSYIPINVDYDILEVTMDDFNYISSHYIRIGNDDEYLINAIKRGMLKAVDSSSTIMGFIGEHPEHTMGLLYVDEAYRRRGIGRNLEYALINHFLSHNKRAVDHVVISNMKSTFLQNSIPGMKEDEGFFYWFF